MNPKMATRLMDAALMAGILLGVFLVVGSIYPFEVSTGTRFYVSEADTVIRIEYSDTEYFTVTGNKSLGYFVPEPDGLKGDFLIRIAADKKPFLSLVQTCTHELKHYEMTWDRLSTEQEHQKIKEEYGFTVLDDLRPICFKMTAIAVTG